MFSESNERKFRSHSFHLQYSGIFQTRMNLRGDPMKMNFNNFQIPKRISKTFRARKVDEKNRVTCLVSFFPSWFMVLKLPQIVHFWQICAELSRKSKFIKTIYLYPSEWPYHALSETSIFYSSLNNSSKKSVDSVEI